jgi:hypothetical protein
MKTKICNKCKIEKPFSEFHKGNDKNRLRYECKSCRKQYDKDNAVNIAKRMKRYHKNNAPLIAKQRKHYYKENVAHITEQQKQYNKNNAPQIAKRMKQYHKDNAPHIVEQRKQRNKNNASFETYAKQLETFEEIRQYPKNTKFLQVKCAYCGKWMLPTNSQVKNRIQVFTGNVRGENRFYCSENCKQSCPIFYQIKYPKGFKKATSREVVPLLRQLVLKRDDYTCQKCGATTDTAQLHAHHEKSYTLNKIMANDPDNCITLCKECHKWIHSQEGCTYFELRCQRKEEN